jgi:predicted TIM-barrel fold metal-dependent hydrolase
LRRRSAFSTPTERQTKPEEGHVSPNLTAVLQEILQNTSNLNVLMRLMTPDVTYVSLNFDNPELRKIEPWAGTHKGPQEHALGLPDNLLDFPTDTNRAVAQMHYTNRFARTPNVKYIFSHAGGSIPYLAARFAIVDEMGFISGGKQRGSAADTLRRIYWDTALAASDPVLRMLRDVVGVDQVLYGTDFPYLRRDLAVNSKQRILQSRELSDSEKQAVLGRNASGLLPNRFLSPSVTHDGAAHS